MAATRKTSAVRMTIEIDIPSTPTKYSMFQDRIQTR